eukprot:TRINITY_DN42831_c0_g1_i1.p1 TRINITY_DN42831_c0_g1~~TRINITY_DN42831_c0_g1_i1.p1  ORF type:complete len:225 (-),score=17.90 TRINITY_DN42831_c0_g1_i1:188-862(-)
MGDVSFRALNGECHPIRAENKGKVEGFWGVQMTSKVHVPIGVYETCRRKCCGPRRRYEDSSYLNALRQLHMWRYSRGIFSHHAVGFSYETVVGSSRCLRFLKVEIFHDEDGVFLRFEGPLKIGSKKSLDHKAYEKSLEHIDRISLREVQSICVDVFRNFGEYHELSNNCQHFASEVLARLVARQHQNELSACANKRVREEHLNLPVAPGEPSPSPQRRKRRRTH